MTHTKEIAGEYEETEEEFLLTIPKEIDGLTQKKLLDAIDVTTKIKGGETEHTINNSLEVARNIRDILLNRAFRLEKEVEPEDVTKETREKVIDHYKDELERIGLDVKKKKVE